MSATKTTSDAKEAKAKTAKASVAKPEKKATTSKKTEATKTTSRKAAESKPVTPRKAEPSNLSVHVQDRLLQVILAPSITEKATHVADKYQQIAFKVRTDATKPEIKAAIELVFKVEVADVNVANMRGKQKRAGRIMGRRQDWKKAYVSLKPGQEINFVGE